MPESGIGVILLAAGRGSRFGPEPKLLERLDGKPLVRHAAEAAFASGLRPIVVVLGANAVPVRAAIADLDPVFVENPRHAEGLSTSLRIGLEALPETVTAAVVMLGDMPRIAGHHLDRLASAFHAAPDAAAIVPVSGRRRGNPVLLNRARLGTELAALVGDRGAGSLLAERGDVVEIPMDAAVGQDVDTREALAGLRQA